MNRRETDRRKHLGAYYTPDEVVRLIVDRTLEPLFPQDDSAPPIRILDPACGDGQFLAGAAQWLSQRMPQASSGLGSPQIDRLLRQCLFGVDVDDHAVQAARERLSRFAYGDESTEAAVRLDAHQSWQSNIRCADALLDSAAPNEAHSRPADLPRAPLPWDAAFPEFASADAHDGFDAVIGNPPYINIRRLARSRGKTGTDWFRQRYRCARGSFDLYVLFLERALELLRPGGWCGMIVPNKLLTQAYASTCREMLARETTVHEIVDMTRSGVFSEASVYPCIIVWQKQPPAPGHRIRISRVDDERQLHSVAPVRRIVQQTVYPRRGFSLQPALEVERRAPVVALGEMAQVVVGTAGFAAARVANFLHEQTRGSSDGGFPFVTSGNVDRYAIRLGDVRFMKRRFENPVLPRDAPVLSAKKKELFEGAKIVLAGMVRRIEAAWDPGGLALGVQVYAVAGAADPWYVLGLLNSRLMTFLLRNRFAGKELAGHYVALNKGPLMQLPIRQIDVQRNDEARMGREIAASAKRLTELTDQRAGPPNPANRLQIDEEIAFHEALVDRHVYALYDLTESERGRVEAEEW